MASVISEPVGNLAAGSDPPRKPPPKPSAPLSKSGAPKKKKGSRSSYFVGAFTDLPPDPSNRSERPNGAVFASVPPPHLSTEEATQYRNTHHALLTANTRTKITSRGRTDVASRARRELWRLWYVARDAWHALGEPAVDFTGNEAERVAHVDHPKAASTGIQPQPIASSAGAQAQPTAASSEDNAEESEIPRTTRSLDLRELEMDYEEMGIRYYKRKGDKK